MNKQQLAAKIWESANQMRSKIEANEYKDYILGFIFYKYLSDKEVQFLKKNDFTDADIKELTEEDVETTDFIKTNIGYFIEYKNLFSTWITKGSDFGVSDVHDALSAFSRLINPTHKKLFDKVFLTLETGLSKLGENAGAQTKSISKLIQLIKAIPMDGRQDYDVLGFIYEYLIEKFAANAGKKAGEFYTPHEVSLLMSDIVADHLKAKKEIQIYDPTSGSGSLLINIGKSVAKHIDNNDNIKYYAQELKENTYNLTRMNLVMRGLKPDNIVTRNGDTLEEDWPFFDENDPVNSYNPLYVDAVVSNPPYSQKWDSENKDADPRYARFGLAPTAKADYAFLLHDLYHLKPDGIMTIVLPHGVLFRGGEEGTIRKNLIEQNHIDAIIGLPPSIFFGTGIPTIVMVLKQRRDHTDTLIIDASKGFKKEGKNNKLRASDIKRIADTVISRESIDKFSKKVSRDEIRKNDYNLNIPRYVDSSEKPESWDIYSSMFGGIPEKELDELNDFWEAFPGLREVLFTKSSDAYAKLNNIDLTDTIEQHESVKVFSNNFKTAFKSFTAYLKMELLDQMETVNTSQEETTICNDIFKRLETIPLIDKYEAYQYLNDSWVKITVDLEMIQTEGFDTTKQVDPNMVTKKKKGKDVEVQDGYVGHVLPFELVQETYLADELTRIRDKENRLAEIASEITGLFDSLNEEDKEQDTVNEAKDGFVNAEVTKEAKQLKKLGKAYNEDDYEQKIILTADLLAEERALKAQLKTETAALHLQTKETIENLSNDQVYQLLELKWITPLVSSINTLPGNMLNQLESKVQELANKYATTYKEVTEKIHETESSLSALIDELTGNEYDLKGLKEFQSLLKNVDDE
ncbi:type I restriction-modification system subunit M [uncultured Draconibacterium sp.]|uniref:type I restriction-modification system subunit M n=1 Tax=uncultured Draconibacterium sp. TaxID=1573823 RepID=UPI002601D081|nr:type I restriction-modification system subunit M [uncultured Draconibacterium sp.]